MEQKMKQEISISSVIKNQQRENCTLLGKLILNVSVKNSKILSNFFYTFVTLSFFILMCTSAIILKQLCELQAQMHSLMLMCQDSQSNRIEALDQFQRSIKYNDHFNPIISSTFEFSNQTKVKDDKHNDTVTFPSNQLYNQIVYNRSIYDKNNKIGNVASNLSDFGRSLNKLTNSFSDFKERQNFRRYKAQNYMTAKGEISNDRSITWSELFQMRRLLRTKRDIEEQRSEEKDETRRQIEEKDEKQQIEEKDETRRQIEEKDEKQQIEERNIRRRQNEKKDGNRWRQNRKERKNRKWRQNRKRSGPLVATFIGALPELTHFNSVNIGPWIKKNESKQYEFTEFHLVEDNMSIEVSTSGLYMISAQIYYFGNKRSYSYWILLNSQGSSKKQKLVTCATFNETMSCYTSLVVYLQKNDRLYLQQQEKDRSINMREGYSHIQITLLANDRRRSM